MSPLKGILKKPSNPANKVLPISATNHRRNQRICTRSSRLSDNNLEVQLFNNSTLSSHNILPSNNWNDSKSQSRTTTISEFIQPKKIYGFLGLGIMGSGIVKNLLMSGHKVIICEREYDEYLKFAEDGAGVDLALNPCDVFDRADITFSCISNPKAVTNMIFGKYGILSSTTIANKKKGYVEMTGIDSNTSLDIANAIALKGGRYLEAQLQGSKQQADQGSLIILGAGELPLFQECQSCFASIAKYSFFLGNVGNATNMYLVLQMISGIHLAALTEGLNLADHLGLPKQDVLEILALTNTSSSMILKKGNAIMNGDYSTNESLLNMQKDLNLTLQISENLNVPMPLTATANEIYKHSVKNGLADLDTAAIYIQ